MGVRRRKDIKQEEARLYRKQAQKAQKIVHMQEPNLVRTSGKESFKKKIIIFAEGKNTEKTYFERYNYP